MFLFVCFYQKVFRRSVIAEVDITVDMGRNVLLLNAYIKSTLGLDMSCNCAAHSSLLT